MTAFGINEEKVRNFFDYNNFECTKFQPYAQGLAINFVLSF